MRYLVDTNVLLRRALASSSQSSVCDQAVSKLVWAEHELHICAQVVIEFWAVSTRPPDVNGLGLTPAVTSQQTAELREAFICLPEPPDMAERWQAIAEKHSIRGKQAHDARLVAIMLAHNVTHILTLNPVDFARYPEITTVTPQDVASQS